MWVILKENYTRLLCLCLVVVAFSAVKCYAKDIPMSKPAHTNALIHSKSPYLLQHAHNPVNWYPWGPEALEKARSEDKPIFLSIGYSACHWCHVMERESFENEEIAEIMNKHFISIKVDREERPDIDEIYMTAVQMMTSQGGWPLSVFLTPDRKPFFGGTYWPPEPRYGRPGFKQILEMVAGVYEKERDKVDATAGAMLEALKKRVPEGASDDSIGEETIKAAADQLAASFDAEWGGFGSAPKFPSVTSIRLLLRHYKRTGDKRVLNMATVTLDRMASGGMRDHVGGGFHRYSVDRYWLVPHFEKMLYDNAQLAILYLEAHKLTGKPLYLRVLRGTLDYVLREMTDEGGGFYSTQDADSEGEEGRFYVWTPDEIDEALGESDGAFVRGYFGVTKKGNFEGKNILYLPGELEAFAKKEKLDVDKLVARLAKHKETLYRARLKRVPPGLDDKILTDWNALMVSAFARAYGYLGDAKYKSAAVRGAGFLLGRMRKNGRLLHAYRRGVSHIDANLADYAYTAWSFLDLYEATHDVQWVREADALAVKMIELFRDDRGGGFFTTPADRTDIIARRKSGFDGSVPSANGVAAHVLLKLGALRENDYFSEKGFGVIRSFADSIRRAPHGYSALLSALDFHLGPVREVVVAGPVDDSGTAELLKAVSRLYLPNTVIHLVDTTAPDGTARAKLIPNLGQKNPLNGRATAYVCKGRSCSAPVVTGEKLEKLLGVK